MNGVYNLRPCNVGKRTVFRTRIMNYVAVKATCMLYLQPFFEWPSRAPHFFSYRACLQDIQTRFS